MAARPAVLRLALAAVIVFQVALAGAWLLVDRTPPYWDEAWYLYQGAAQFDALRQGGPAPWYAAFTGFDRTRPSLVPALTLPAFAAFGVSARSGLLVDLLALAALLLATYGLGSAVAGRPAGLLAAMIVASYPVLVGLAHILLVEMTMVALVAATLLALWRADGFRRAGWSAAAGLLAGLGLLAKPHFAVFLAGPWLVALWQGWQERGRPASRARLRNIVVALLLAVLLAATWYAPNLSQFVTRTNSAALGTEAAPYGPDQPLYWRNLLAYYLNLIGTGLGLPGFLLLLLGFAGLVRRQRGPAGPGWINANERIGQTAALAADSPRSGLKPALFLLSSFIAGCLVFASLRNQDIKHISGVLPAAAVLTAWGLVRLAPRRQAAVTVAVAAVMAAQSLLGTFPGPLQGRAVVVPVLGAPLALFFPARSWLEDTRYAAPDPRPWPLAALLDYALDVADLQTLPHDRVRMAVIPDYPGLEEYALRFEASLRQLPVDLSPAFVANLDDQDVLVAKTGDAGFAPRLPEVARIMQALAAPGAAFQPLPRTFALPDGSRAVLYARSSPLLPTAPQPAHAAAADFGAAARFLGFDYDVAARGGVRSVSLTYYWQSLAATTGDYSLFVHLLDPATGEIVAQDDHLLFPRVYPTGAWQPGPYLRDARQVTLPPTYRGSSVLLRLGLYRGDARLPVAGAAVTYLDAGVIELSKSVIGEP